VRNLRPLKKFQISASDPVQPNLDMARGGMEARCGIGAAAWLPNELALKLT
jgi:hypothetical protein